jgi:hypothetical protein
LVDDSAGKHYRVLRIVQPQPRPDENVVVGQSGRRCGIPPVIEVFDEYAEVGIAATDLVERVFEGVDTLTPSGRKVLG